MAAHSVQPDGVQRDRTPVFCSSAEVHVAAVCKPQASLFVTRIVPVRFNPILKQHKVSLSFELGHVH